MAVRRYLLSIIWIASVALWSDSRALSLTDIEVSSQLNQPLIARIDIIVESQQEIDNLEVRLGSSAEFSRRKLYYSSLIQNFKFQVVQDEATGAAYIVVTSEASITTPLIDFLIELKTTGQEILQQYTILLDPDSYGVTTAANIKKNQGETEITVEYEIDPYYSNIGIFVSLNDNSMKKVDVKDEGTIYLDLLKDAFSPSFFLVEFSVNPLPVLSTILKEDHEGTYEDADINDDLNLIQALTEGFEEPYALSFFVGSVIRFVSPEESDFLTVNKGFSGLLLSIGDQHIKDAVLFDDDWYEVEWKIKGDRRIGSVYHSWSFRLGSKLHSNSDIADVNYIGVRREYFNDKLGNYRWNENIGIDFSLYFSRADGELVQQQFFVEKNWPTASGNFTLGIGLNRFIDRYTGELADEDDDLRLIIRPGLSF
jgi:hypothetical protein